MESEPAVDQACARPPRDGGQRRLRTLYCLAVACIAASWYVASTDRFYRDRMRALLWSGRWQASASLIDPTSYETRDPSLASEFPRHGLGAAIRRTALRQRGGYLIAALGDCGTCTTLRLDKLHRQLRRRQITLLAFGSGTPVMLKDFRATLKRDGLSIPVFADADNELSARLNAYYPGRLYLYTPDWRLRWLETDMRIDNYLVSTGRLDRILANTDI